MAMLSTGFLFKKTAYRFCTLLLIILYHRLNSNAATIKWRHHIKNNFALRLNHLIFQQVFKHIPFSD